MKRKIIIGLLSLAVLAGGCKKEGQIIPNESLVHFQNQTSGTYYIQNDPASVYNVPVGSLTVSDKARTVSYTVTSPTGAVAGTHYSIANSGSVTIPAGQSTASIQVKGIFANYPTGRIDTLRFTITGGDEKAADYNQTFTLVLQKYCSVSLAGMQGNYTKTRELFGTSAYGPYTTSISAVTPVSATKGKITVQNIFDSGWGPIEFDLDWTDPANFKATVVAKSSGIADAGTLNATYAGQQVAVRPFSGQDGSFSSCDNTLTLKMQLGVANVGWFSQLYTVTLAR